MKENIKENIFKMKYLDLFVKYFNNKNQLKELLIGDTIITLSYKTKTFYDLLQKIIKGEVKLKEGSKYYQSFCKMMGERKSQTK